jgi:DNA-binding LacI/PurR family transcriptional regulator
MRQALGHLTALGHTRCAFVSGPERSWSNQQRLRGLRAAAGAASADVVTIGPVAPQFEGGVQAADRVLASGATAVLAYNDLVAAGILSRLAQLGIDVPGRLSVVGFDDIPLAAMLTPALTTVAAPTAQAGAAAVDALLCRLEPVAPAGRPAPSDRRLPATLVVRGSTAPPAEPQSLSQINQGAV